MPNRKSSFELPKVKKEFSQLLSNIKDMFTEEELQHIQQAYDLMKSSGKSKARLVRPILPIREWVNNTYYLGPDSENIYPFWKEELIKIFESEHRINQVIISGALGTGKSTMAVLIIIRVIYELSCYEHISALFNLFGVSRIAFAYLSVTREQAQNTGFALLVEWIDSIPYFKEKFRRKDGLDSMVIWPEERLIVTFGSVANHFIGMNLIGSILDEANFFSGRSKEESDYAMNTKVAGLYTQIITRAESRFIINGVNHAISILVSSATVSSSFTEERIKKASDDPHTYIISPALWEAKPWNYKGKTFLVYTGGNNIEPFVLRTIEDINMLLLSKQLSEIQGNVSVVAGYNMLPAEIKTKIIKVPEEHTQSFQGDIIIALQDIAGFSVSAATRLFNSETAYNKCILDSVAHPFSAEHITLSTTKEPTQAGFLPIKAYLLNGHVFPNKKQKRFLHLDLALTGDSAGIAMSHISGWQSIYKQPSNFDQIPEDNITGLVEDEIRIPVVTVDFMLKINPPKKPNAISLGKVRDFIVYLKNEHGINFGLITADQFQSAQILQELEELGFETKGLSVDRTPEAYLTFVNLIYEERTKFYSYEPFRRELFNLVYYPARRKVDHPSKGSKDVSDCVAGSTFMAIKSLDKTGVDEDSIVQLFIDSNKHGDQYSNEVDAFMKNLDKLLRGN